MKEIIAETIMKEQKSDIPSQQKKTVEQLETEKEKDYNNDRI